MYMVYITGDTHGDFNRVIEFQRKMHLTKQDTLIILGDAGINYSGGMRDVDCKEFLSTFPFTIFCIHGNHEMRPTDVMGYTTKEYCGGTVYYEEDYPNILFAKDGEIYNLDGFKCLVIGGAYSVDKWHRVLSAYNRIHFMCPDLLSADEYERALMMLRGQTNDADGSICKSLEKVIAMLPKNGYGWFESEQPSDEIKAYVESQIAKVDNTVDIVLSHTCPLKYEPTEVFLSGLDQSSVDKSTEEWMDKIESILSYKRWFCGHFHTIKKIDKMQFMFEDFDILHD